MNMKHLIARIVNGLVGKLKHTKSSYNYVRDMQTDLSLISSDLLIDELVKRYDHIGIAGLKFTNNNYDYVQLRRRGGNRHMVIAQLELFKQVLVKEDMDSSIKIEGNMDR